jgi:AraC-like DNA-binding protein
MEDAMATQPILNEQLAPVGEVKMNCKHSNTYFDIESHVSEEPHIHSCFEIYVNISGDVNFLHENEIYEICPFDMVISHPADLHHCIYRSSCVHEHYCLWFTGDIGNYLEQKGIRGRVRPDKEKTSRLAWLLKGLSSKEESFLKTAKLFELISLLNVTHENEACERIPDRVSDIMDYTEAHLAEIRCTKQVARQFFISESTLNRIFRAQVGMAFGKYLENKRLSLAERFLRSGHSVTEACFLSGFSDCSRFIMKFKENFGTTPLKYKKSLK